MEMDREATALMAALTQELVRRDDALDEMSADMEDLREEVLDLENANEAKATRIESLTKENETLTEMVNTLQRALNLSGIGLIVIECDPSE